MLAGVAEAAAAIVAVERIHLEPLDLFHSLQHELGDAVAAMYVEGLVRVGVQQHHLDLAPIGGIDEAGRVGHRDPVVQRVAATRQHEPGVPDGNGDGDARGHQQAATRRQHHTGFASPQIEAGKLRFLASAAEARWPDYPDVKTLREMGFDAVSNGPFGYAYPTGVEPAIRDRMEKALADCMADESVRKQIDNLGIEPIWRDGKELEKTVTLRPRPDLTSKDGKDDDGENAEAAEEAPSKTTAKIDAIGLAVRNLTAEERDKYHVSNGVMITSIDPASEASDRGLQRNLVITEADYQKIKSAGDLEKIIAGRKGKAVGLMVTDAKGDSHWYALRVPKD